MRLIVTLLALGLCGCATYQYEVIMTPIAKLEPGKSVLIAMPRNGTLAGFGQGPQYQGSGEQTAAVVQTAFARFADRATVSSRCSNLSCLQGEAGIDYRYLVVPDILRWEDWANFWYGAPDLVRVHLVVVDSQSSAEVVSVVISGRSKGLTHPQKLLIEPITKYVEGLY